MQQWHINCLHFWPSPVCGLHCSYQPNSSKGSHRILSYPTLTLGLLHHFNWVDCSFQKRKACSRNEWLMIYFCMGFAVSPVEQEIEWIMCAVWAGLLSDSLGYPGLSQKVSGHFQQGGLGFSLEGVCWRSHGRLESTWLHLFPQIGVLEEAERNQMLCLCASWIQELLCGRERKTRAGEQRFGMTVLLMHFSVGLTLLAEWLEIVVVGEQASICLCFWAWYFFSHMDNELLE